MDASRMQDVLTLIQMEYLEMPDLKLSLRQAMRLFNLPLESCENALGTLVSVGFLMQTRDGSFLRRHDATASFAPLLAAAAKADAGAAVTVSPSVAARRSFRV